MKKNKIIIASIVLLLVFVVGGALAFFTDSDTKTNTFTVGDVEISLDEPNWDDTDSDSDGVPDAAEGVMPGDSISKDPVITNTGSNDVYVFAKVEIPCTTDSSAEEIFAYTINNGWYLMSNGSCTSGTATKIYAYGTSSAMTALPSTGTNSTTTLFDTISLNSTIDGSETGLSGNKSVVVTGYGIQTTGLGSATTPSAIWTAASFN